jgi:hypothetical protein
MQVNTTLRQDMLNLLKTSITVGYGAVVPTKTIKFYSSSHGSPLCTVTFDDLEIYTDGDRVGYKFKSSDGTMVLRGVVENTGTVSNFEIDGVLSSEAVVTNMLYGTVGGLSTSADIRFNSLNWTEGVNISLSNLAIIMLQGA